MARSVYSEITPEMEALANLCVKNGKIDPELYAKYDVKRGLRDINGNGVLTGLTDISEIRSSRMENGVKIPCEGQLSDDWTYYTDEQLAELSGVVAESSEEMQKAMEDGKSTYDMFASAMEGLVTINVVYEDLGALYGKLLDEAGYLEIAVPKLEDALTSMGLSNVKVEQTPVQFAGLVREGAVISGEMDGVPMYETLVCIKQEGYMCCVTMCSWTEDITADLVELFYQA